MRCWWVQVWCVKIYLRCDPWWTLVVNILNLFVVSNEETFIGTPPQNPSPCCLNHLLHGFASYSYRTLQYDLIFHSYSIWVEDVSPLNLHPWHWIFAADVDASADASEACAHLVSQRWPTAVPMAAWACALSWPPVVLWGLCVTWEWPSNFDSVCSCLFCQSNFWAHSYHSFKFSGITGSR